MIPRWTTTIMPSINKRTATKYPKVMWDGINIELMGKAFGTNEPRTIKEDIELIWSELPDTDRIKFMENTIPKMEQLVRMKEMTRMIEKLREEVDDLKIMHRNLVATVKGRNKGREVDY